MAIGKFIKPQLKGAHLWESYCNRCHVRHTRDQFLIHVTERGMIGKLGGRVCLTVAQEYPRLWKEFVTRTAKEKLLWTSSS